MKIHNITHGVAQIRWFPPPPEKLLRRRLDELTLELVRTGPAAWYILLPCSHLKFSVKNRLIKLCLIYAETCRQFMICTSSSSEVINNNVWKVLWNGSLTLHLKCFVKNGVSELCLIGAEMCRHFYVLCFRSSRGMAPQSLYTRPPYFEFRIENDAELYLNENVWRELSFQYAHPLPPNSMFLVKNSHHRLRFICVQLYYRFSVSCFILRKFRKESKIVPVNCVRWCAEYCRRYNVLYVTPPWDMEPQN